MRELRHGTSFLLVCLVCCAVHAAERGSVAGRVLTAGGEPVADASVDVAGAPRVRTDRKGAFIATLPAGAHTLLVSHDGFGMAAASVTVAANATVDVEIRLSPSYRDEIVVSAGVDVRAASELAQPAAVVSGGRLDALQQPSLGATIEGEPGVSTSSFGTAVGRPIVRGLGNDRVRILSNGTDSGDLSAGAADHAVDAGTGTATRIEILRGAATLLYGSSASGGVVNVIDDRVPEAQLDRAITGSASLGYGSSATDRNGALQLAGTSGNLGWSASASGRDTGDYSIPGEVGEGRGRLENSALRNSSVFAGASWIGAAGFLGAALSRTGSTYGVPGHHEHHEHEEEEEEEHGGPEIALRQNRADVRGHWHGVTGFIEDLRLSAAVSDYEHVEKEAGGEIGLRATQKSHDSRLELQHAAIGPVGGSAGVQLRHRRVTSVGEEAFVPSSDFSNAAVFALEEIATPRTRWQGGIRYERQTSEGDPGVAPRRSYRALSSSAGVVWLPSPSYSIGLSAARAAKFPSPEELYANGPHLASRTFEIGDPDLRMETGLSTSLSLRKLLGRVTGEINLFGNRFDDFIHQRYSGEEIDGFPVLLTENGDATFYGGEIALEMQLLARAGRQLTLSADLERVRAELDTGEPLPRIPAMELGAALRLSADRYWAELGVARVSAQTRVAPHEQPSAAYTTLAAAAGWRWYARQTAHDVLLRGTNLTNREIRPHTSFLKDVAPQPGRDLAITYRVTF
jgi:iron complex outermembrane recepter protein